MDEFNYMLYLNLNAWCVKWTAESKGDVLAGVLDAQTPEKIETLLAQKGIQAAGYFVYLHLDKARGCWMLPRSLN